MMLIIYLIRLILKHGPFILSDIYANKNRELH
jgi:hypothetical protein